MQQKTTVCFCNKVWDKMSGYILKMSDHEQDKKLFEIATPQQPRNKRTFNFISQAMKPKRLFL